MKNRIQVNTSLVALKYANDVFKGLDHEELWILYLNNNNEPVSFERVTVGGWTSTVIDLRQIFSIGLNHHSTGMIMFHNHLSGVPKPSESDITITRNVNKVGKILEIQLVDHIIISDRCSHEENATVHRHAKSA